MKTKFTILSIITGGVLILSACKKDKDSVAIEAYDIPTTYNFAGANYASSTNRIQMYNELNAYLGKVTSANVDNTVSLNYFNNTNNLKPCPDS